MFTSDLETCLGKTVQVDCLCYTTNLLLNASFKLFIAYVGIICVMDWLGTWKININ